MTCSQMLRLGVATIALTLVGCGGRSSAAKRYEVTLQASTDDGEPMKGVRFTSGKSAIGTTDERGLVSATIRGADGQSVPLSVTCPEGYVAPEEAPKLRLTEVRRVGQSDVSGIRTEAVCTRKQRDIVVVVRTAGAPSLPVDVGGKTLGETDANGIAHIPLTVERDVRSLSVNLGTSTLPTLRPQNPSRVFELDGRDAILLVEQSFDVERKAPLRRKTIEGNRAPRKRVPQRIDSTRFHAL